MPEKAALTILVELLCMRINTTVHKMMISKGYFLKTDACNSNQTIKYCVISVSINGDITKLITKSREPCGGMSFTIPVTCSCKINAITNTTSTIISL